MLEQEKRWPKEIDELIQSVQINCDISDYRHAADYTICIYLLRMREYYRWSEGLDWGDSIDQAALMTWISEKERIWEALEEQTYQPLTVAGELVDPFDQDIINAILMPHELVYQAGYGRQGKPIFVLAELKSIEHNDDYVLVKTGEEYARELVSPPAYTQLGRITIRYHALSRVIWDLVEEWRWKKPDNAMAKVVEIYDFDTKPMEALQRATQSQAEMLVLHELGEIVSGQLLDQNWNDWLSGLLVTEVSRPDASEPNRVGQTIELFARAIRDNLADCLITLPGLLSQNDSGEIHFYFAGLTPLRKSLLPSLISAYGEWQCSGQLRDMKDCIIKGQKHWLAIGNQLVRSDAQRASLDCLIKTHAL